MKIWILSSTTRQRSVEKRGGTIQSRCRSLLTWCTFLPGPFGSLKLPSIEGRRWQGNVTKKNGARGGFIYYLWTPILDTRLSSRPTTIISSRSTSLQTWVDTKPGEQNCPSEKEVITGKGQFACSSKHCQDWENLESWEVNFAYVEQGERKNTLVKLRLCPLCSLKLNSTITNKGCGRGRRRAWRLSKSKKKYKWHGKEKHRHKHKHKQRANDRETSKGIYTSDESSDSLSDSDDTESVVTEKGSLCDSEAKSSMGQSQEQSADSGAVWSKSAEALLEKSKEEE